MEYLPKQEEQEQNHLLAYFANPKSTPNQQNIPIFDNCSLLSLSFSVF
jgi:hypothetical protein